MSEPTIKAEMVCPVCTNGEARVANHPTQDASVVDCPQCGQFTISRDAVVNLRNEDNSKRWKISAWIREFSPSIVGPEDIEQALKAPVPGLHHRADRMLRELNLRYPQGVEFSASDVYSKLIGVGWNRSASEVRYMLEEVLEREFGYLSLRASNLFRITAKGLIHLEGAPNRDSHIGFCAMWFSPEVLPLWTQVIEPATRAAGYEPLRIDSKQHNGKIDDEIMASIRASRFVVSDFTGNRGGVYYEAGFAHGLGLPVIFMCREGDELHFDIRQYNCIFWKPGNLEDALLQLKLKNRILATLGQGPRLVQ